MSNAITIRKMERPIYCGDWHDPPLKWSVNGPNAELQQFHNREEARRYRRCRMRAKDANEASSIYLRESI